MNRTDGLTRLKFLFDQVHQTAEREEHLEERMPLHVHPESLNYDEDLVRIKGEYNRLAQELRNQGLVSADQLEAEGLPLTFERHK